MDFKIGDRVQITGFRGTVRYVGEIQGSKGTWLGVDWDNVERGKHSGEKNGIVYFTTTLPGSGSFVRPQKVEDRMDFLSALIERYVPRDEESGDVVIRLGGGEHSVQVETVGWEKIHKTQKQLNQLKEVGLVDWKIYGVGPHALEIQERVPNIMDMDLTGNLLGDWDAVAQITLHLPKLQVLRLSRNRFAPFQGFSDGLVSAFSNVHTLSLTKTLIDWSDVLQLEPFFPNLEYLLLGNNKMPTYDHPDTFIPGFLNLKFLSLEDNGIADWNEVARFSRLPQLATLDLSSNAIGTILPHTPSAMDFCALTKLLITDNKIDNWASIDYLNTLPKLTDLRIMSNPLITTAKDLRAVQILIIARIHDLSSLNGSPVLKRGISSLRNEREDAEIYYLKACLKESIENGWSTADIPKHHPRYLELCKKHDAPTLESEATKSKLIKDKLIQVTVSLYTGDKCKQSISKKFLGTMTIRNLKNTLKRTFDLVDTSRLTIYRITMDNNNEPLHIPLDNDLRELGFYDIVTGEELRVMN